MIFNRIVEKFSNRALICRSQKAQLEMDKYLSISKPWEVSENSTSLVKELYDIKDMVLNFAKKNNVHVDMFVPKESDVLSLTVSRIIQ